MSSKSKSAAHSDLAKYCRSLIDVIIAVITIIIATTQKAWAVYKALPEDYIQLLIGFIFCFFGGIFPVLFASIEAAKHGGLSHVTSALSDLSDEVMKIIIASKKDDDADKDSDGVKDVDQVDTKALLKRKIDLVLTKMNPEKIDKAIASICKLWLSVVAVLSMEFARIISLSFSISEFMRKPVQKYLGPQLEKNVPTEYNRWVPVLLGWITKSISMSFAWYVNAVITAMTSALVGALMISRALLSIAYQKGFTLGGIIPKDHEETSIDEVTSYFFAFVGIWFQFKNQFNLPFPLNLLLWPFELCEYYIRWSISK